MLRSFESIQDVPNIISLPIAERVTPDLLEHVLAQVKSERDAFDQVQPNHATAVTLYFGNWWGYVERSMMNPETLQRYYPPDFLSKPMSFDSEEMAHLYSKLRKTLTYGQFYQEIDQAIAFTGLDKTQIADHIERVNKMLDDDAYTEMHDYLLPAYAYMRARGFTWMDLWQ